MTTVIKQIGEEFAKGNLAFAGKYLADDITWNIPGNSPIIGKEQVLEASKMLQLESYPLITIKKIIAEGNCVVVESTGEAKTKKVRLTIKAIARFSYLKTKNCRK